MGENAITIKFQKESGPIQIKLSFYGGNFVQYEARILRNGSSVLEKFKDGNSKDPFPDSFLLPYPADILVRSVVSVICECIPTSMNETFKIDLSFSQDNKDIGKLTLTADLNTIYWITGIVFLNN